MTGMVRSRIAVVAGASLLIASVAAMLFIMGLISPRLFQSCTPLTGAGGWIGGWVCSERAGYLAYLLLLTLFIDGAGLTFYGVFGTRYILSPLFLAGMVPFAWGSAGLAFAYWGSNVCNQLTHAICRTVDPGPFLVAIAGGLLMISVRAIRWNRMSGHSGPPPLANAK